VTGARGRGARCRRGLKLPTLNYLTKFLDDGWMRENGVAEDGEQRNSSPLSPADPDSVSDGHTETTAAPHHHSREGERTWS